ncbi:FAD dependent oxidoreductase [Kluyvera cryocrescens]|uniref:FAD dependent oxidoreductase n=1 Tax=Kluyvera cryocrescens TaxID=580 RepID=A0A485D357_KLUCR|nr:FAD dependent oxidoreductase [Kluyvera cryocrescens]
MEQRDHYDAVGYGGWSIDLHPADGVYSSHDGCRQFHSKGTYTIPYRSLYSRSLDNLFLTGRLISASHVAFGSARVMCTCGLLGEVVGRAAALCQTLQLNAPQLAEGKHIGKLQQHLQHTGCYIPRQFLQDPARGAQVTASSEMQLTTLAANGQWMALEERMALLLPVKAGESLPEMRFTLRSATAQPLKISLLGSQKVANYCADMLLDERALTVEQAGEYRVAFDWRSDADRYLFIVFESNSSVEIALTSLELPGVMTVFNSQNARVAKHPRQIVDGDFGAEEFDFWVPRRRPHQVMPAVHFATPLRCYDGAKSAQRPPAPGTAD